MRPPAFWDSSALIPLCLVEPLTIRVQALYKRYQPVVWWGTSVEIAAAFARLLRVKQLDVSDWSAAKLSAEKLSTRWAVIQPSEILRTRAQQIVENYDLRAAGAFQLAAALDWCGDTPTGRIFFSADRRLRDAALLCGFDCPML